MEYYAASVQYLLLTHPPKYYLMSLYHFFILILYLSLSSSSPFSPETTAPMEQICIIGSGNWATAIATIVGRNAASLLFCNDTVRMWVYDEPVLIHNRTMNLSEVINTFHVNNKYLPNITIPHNVMAVPDLQEACRGATLLIFALPHQFLTKALLETIAYGLLQQPSCKQRIRGISLIKGGLEFNGSSITLLSQRIQQTLTQLLHQEFTCGVLMGANLADEVAAQHLSECTLACDFNKDHSSTLLNEQTRLIFHCNTHFRVQQVTDVITTEVCGALKNIYALGAGFIDALHLGSNTKAALLRIALMEIKTFCHLFFSSMSPTCTPETTLWESCGVADLITTCVGGRNRKCAETFAKLRLDRHHHHHHSRVHNADDGRKENSSNPLNIEESIQLWQKIEQEVLQGQKLQGTWTCQEVTTVLQATHTQEYFPLLYTIYKIAFLGQAIESIVDGIVMSPSSLLPKIMSLGHHRLEKSRL